MKHIILALAIAGLSSGAFAQSVTEKAASTLGMTPPPKASSKMPRSATCSRSNSSKLAQEKGDASVKTFAAKMIKDHTGTSSELKAIAAKAKVDVPTALDSSHQSKLDKLKSLNGEDFVKQYDADQLAAHKDAVSMFERYAKGGDNAQLKAFAKKTLPHLKQHLQMAEGLNKTTTGQK